MSFHAQPPACKSSQDDTPRETSCVTQAAMSRGSSCMNAHTQVQLNSHGRKSCRPAPPCAPIAGVACCGRQSEGQPFPAAMRTSGHSSRASAPVLCRRRPKPPCAPAAGAPGRGGRAGGQHGGPGGRGWRGRARPAAQPAARRIPCGRGGPRWRPLGACLSLCGNMLGDTGWCMLLSPDAQVKCFTEMT